MKRFDDAAQLLLIAGFAVGVGIVVLTVMLNNVIYASNIASESSIDTFRFDMENSIQMSTEAYEDAYQHTMDMGAFNQTLFEQQITSYSKKASENYGASGFTFHLGNNNISEPYYSQNGLEDGKDEWTIVKNVNFSDAFVFEIPNSSNLANESESLIIKAVNGSGTLWSAKLYNSSGIINMTIRDDSSIIGTKQISGGVGLINVTGNLASGHAFSYDFRDHTDGNDYSIKILNGSHTKGTFYISGNLTNGNSFSTARYKVVNPTLTMSSSDIKLNRTIAISLPGGAA